MDLLFTRYASPFSLLDKYIKTGRFLEYIDTLTEIQQEDIEWEYFLHKVFDQSWEQFDAQVKGQRVQVQDEPDLGTTIDDSFNILSGFNPNPEL